MGFLAFRRNSWTVASWCKFNYCIINYLISEVYLIGNAVALMPGEFYLFKFKLLADNTKKQITSKEIN